MEKKEKKIVFSEQVDSKITGLAIVFAFISVGIFLLLFPDYFGSKVASGIVRWIFISIGMIGLMVELSKNKKGNIKGFDNFFIGAVLVGVWTVLFLFINVWWVNIISFFFLLIGLYGLYKGLIEIIYSAYQTAKNHNETKKNITTDIALLFSKFASLVLVIVQIIKALGIK
jgi:hypothetical protein